MAAEGFVVADQVRLIRRATVAAINGRGYEHATVPSISAAAGLTDEEFLHRYPSVEAVVRDIAASVRADRTDRIDATLVRRRSLTSSLQAALIAIWEVVDDRLDEHCAILQVVLRGGAGHGPSGTTFHEDSVAECAAWLHRIVEIQVAAWTSPVDDLARMTTATLNGLISGCADTLDRPQIVELLRLMAFQLSQHARKRGEPTSSGRC